MLNLPSIPYGSSREGYWNPVTSTLNWCEEDYYATEYIAEIVNTLTNSVFVYLAYRGLRNCIKNGHDTVFMVAFCTYLFIGIGSILFHTTLKYSMQLLDELSMIYTSCTMFYAVFSFGRPKWFQNAVMIFAIALATSITAVYHYLKDPVFHQNAFALLTSVVVLTSIYKMEQLLRPGSKGRREALAHVKGRKSSAAELERRDKRDLQILKEMWFMIGCGLVSVGVGFFIWNLDNIYCDSLRRWRKDIGLPWGILLEGHGWWHIMTGLSCYFNLTWGVWLRYCHKGMQDDVEVIWPSIFTSVPVVVQKSKKKAVAGHRKKE